MHHATTLNRNRTVLMDHFRLLFSAVLISAFFKFCTAELHVNADTPTEYECRPYIEKAIQDLKTGTGKEHAAQAHTETQ